MTKIFVITPWLSGAEYHKRLAVQTPDCSSKWGDIESCDNFDQADYYIAFWCGDPLLRKKCRPKSVINVMNESSYYIPKSGDIGTETIISRWVTENHNPLTWWIEKTYSELSEPFPEKSAQVSCVTTGRYLTHHREYALKLLRVLNSRSSRFTNLFGQKFAAQQNIPQVHRHRIHFLKRFTQTFPKVLDLYGNNIGGFDLSTIDGYKGALKQKWSGLAPYRYSFAFENVSEKNYLTEKLIDCILAGCMPIYWGCTNLHDFLPKNSFVQLDITKPDSVVKAMNFINSDFREQNIKALQEAKDLILNKYQFWPTVQKIIHGLDKPIKESHLA
jgi:hypothetical protein